MVQKPVPAVILAGASSHVGKTILSMGLIGALRRRGMKVRAAKCGPDYIDPVFLEKASGAPALNLDPWAMPAGALGARFHRLAEEAEIVVIEGAMGLFDGGRHGAGSTASLARALDCPVILVIAGSGIAQSAGAIAQGFIEKANGIQLAGAIVNQVGSDRHGDLIREGFEDVTAPLLGTVGRDSNLKLESRHLGLVQAREHAQMAPLLEGAADRVEKDVDVEALLSLIYPIDPLLPARAPGTIPPLGRHVAIARDDAFSFLYPHLLEDWKAAGTRLSYFSPLANEPPASDADGILLPGGYPELHAPGLAAASRFMKGLHAAAGAGARIYGECGGYMVLGSHLIDCRGRSHAMAGLLPLVTSFQDRRLHLGYRRLKTQGPAPFPAQLNAHEFHYATIRSSGPGEPLFQSSDLSGNDLGPIGLKCGSVMGSFAHLIDCAS